MSTRPLRRFYVVLGLSLAVAILVGMTLVTPILGTRADFSVYNGGWNGASQLGKQVHGTGTFRPLFQASDSASGMSISPVALTTESLEPARGTIVILGPQADFTPEEIQFLRNFVERGGLLLLADDFGTGNQVLEGVGATTRIDPTPVLDFAFAKRPEFTVAVDFVEDPIFDGVTRALLNFPAALVLGPNVTALANTTEAAWLDKDGDGLRGATERGGPFVWMAQETVGQGTILLLSDPSVLINGMRPFAHNERLVENVVARISDGREKIVIDESHRSTADPISFLGLRLREASPLVRFAVGAVVALGIAIVATGKFSFPTSTLRARLAALLQEEPPTSSRAALLDRVRKRHPDWDETTLRHILAGWEEQTRS